MKTCKVVLVGDDRVGKTSLLKRICDGEFVQSQDANWIQTDELLHVQVIGDAEITIKMKFHEHRKYEATEYYKILEPLAYPQTDIFLLCFSVVNVPSLQHINKMWCNDVTEYCPEGKRILVGLKSDLNWMRYDHEKLVFGYVHQMAFLDKSKVPDQCIELILKYEYRVQIKYWEYPTISDKMIEETRKDCRCEQYVELSAKTNENVNALLSAIARVNEQNVDTVDTVDTLQGASQGSNCACLVL